MREVQFVIPNELESYVEFLPDNILPDVLLNLLKQRVAGTDNDAETVAVPLPDKILELLENNVASKSSVKEMVKTEGNEEKQYESVHIQLKDNLKEVDVDDMGDLLDLLK